MRRWVSHFRQAGVIERTTGERLGTAQRFLVDRARRAVGAVLLSEPGADRPGLLVPLGAIASFGDHALMVEGRPIEVSLLGLAEWPGGSLSSRYPVGLPVLTASGARCGRVADYRFNFQDGAIEELMVADSFLEDLLRGRRKLPASQVAVFGQDAVILADNVRPFRRPQ